MYTFLIRLAPDPDVAFDKEAYHGPFPSHQAAADFADERGWIDSGRTLITHMQWPE